MVLGLEVGLSVTGEALGKFVGGNVTGDVLGEDVTSVATGDRLGDTVGLEVWTGDVEGELVGTAEGEEEGELVGSSDGRPKLYQQQRTDVIMYVRNTFPQAKYIK